MAWQGEKDLDPLSARVNKVMYSSTKTSKYLCEFACCNVLLSLSLSVEYDL